jgi:hypothetical protein
MYCVACERPVAAQKATHRFRNMAATVTLPATAFVSALAYTKGEWHCPRCGGAVVVDPAVVQARQAQQRKALEWVKTHPKLTAAITLGVLVVSAIPDH